MATETMTKTRFPISFGYVREFEETLAAPGTGDNIITPRGKTAVGVALNPTAGSGYVEYTLSSIAKVKAGTAVWKTWDAGTVSEYADDVFYQVATAIRMVNVSGTTSMFGNAR